jgi:hypothetical protein
VVLSGIEALDVVEPSVAPNHGVSFLLRSHASYWLPLAPTGRFSWCWTRRTGTCCPPGPPEYARWVVSFERGLYQDGMLKAMDAFYRLPRDKPIVFTLGALNCGSYAMSGLRGINPNLQGNQQPRAFFWPYIPSRPRSVALVLVSTRLLLKLAWPKLKVKASRTWRVSLRRRFSNTTGLMSVDTREPNW